MDNRIAEFIAGLELYNSSQAKIVKTLFGIFKETPAINERFIYGGIGIYIADNLIGGIYSNKNHINLVFSRGIELVDKYNVLQGGGKLRRHIQLKTFDDIYCKHCRFYIEQVIDLETE